MEWNDKGFVLSARRYGENSAVVSLLTENYGRYAGLIRTTKKNTAILQLGTYGRATWRARLSEHLGSWSFEPLKITCATLLNQPQALLALSSACILLDLVLPEREVHTHLYYKLSELIEHLEYPEQWWKEYIELEVRMLRELGFGLDLTRCAATGRQENLIYVSPRTGRAVSLEAGTDYKHKLLPLPDFLLNPSAEITIQEFIKGLQLTGYFLERYLLSPYHRKMPLARIRLYERSRG